MSDSPRVVFVSSVELDRLDSGAPTRARDRTTSAMARNVLYRQRKGRRRTVCESNGSQWNRFSISTNAKTAEPVLHLKRSRAHHPNLRQLAVFILLRDLDNR